MANPFGKDGGPINNVSRNTFELSHQNNTTLNYGGIYPCFCKEVLPGDHWKIDTTFGLRFMPTAFPLQTRMRADVHFFYVRNRALYEDWMDLYGMKSYGTNSKECVPPFISPQNARNKDMFGTGGLADYFGVPTTLVGEYGSDVVHAEQFAKGTLVESGQAIPEYPLAIRKVVYNSPTILPDGNLVNPSFPAQFSGAKSWPASNFPYAYLNCVAYRVKGTQFEPLKFNLSTSSRNGEIYDYVPFIAFCPTLNNDFSDNVFSFDGYYLASDTQYQGQIPLDSGLDVDVTVNPVDSNLETSIEITGVTDLNELSRNWVVLVGYLKVNKSIGGPARFDIDSSTVEVTVGNPQALPVRDIIDVQGARIPWEEKPINAYVFRAYEMIYNSFYRDERNNPYVLNGEVQYNKFLPTTAGGEDTNIYKLHRRNWEQDFLTTAVPTPQMGPAPLVGISALGEMSIQDPESGQVYKVMAQTADDNDTIVGMNVTETLPNTVMRSLVNYATSGISINDFRNVNAFQRWLETNIRKGFKYKDQIKAHYAVDIRFDELNMPEFIGGASIDITPTTITQTSQDSEDNPLGSYAGQLYGSGSSKHPVTQYCDEHGFIIGLVSVVPVPNYSQLMPKHFWKKDSLDYFTPEFGHIGLQPIPAREVCPNQMMQDPNADIEKDIFGYQRAHYDYMQAVDEVHGQFRNTLRNFVMNRVFDSKPVLGPDFTVISPDHLNDVFTVQYITDPNTGEKVLVDKILGQMYFNVSVKRPIPRYGVPRLE